MNIAKRDDAPSARWYAIYAVVMIAMVAAAVIIRLLMLASA